MDGSRGSKQLDRESIGRELDDEIEFHLRMRARELEGRGYSRAEAWREAVQRFGDVAATRAVCLESDYRTERRMKRVEWLRELWQDARMGFRQYRRRPGFAVVAVLTLAIGIGANTAIFSAADHVLLRPLPYEDADRVVTLWETDRSTGENKREVAPGIYLQWRERNKAFSAIALAEPFGFDFTGDGPPVPVRAWLVTEEYFDALGVRPLLGRGLRAEDIVGEGSSDGGFTGARVVVISHRLWRDRYGSDPGLIGSTIQLDNSPFTVVGVLPPALDYPEPKDIWAPKRFRPYEPEERTSGYMQVVARLQPGVSVDAAQRDMDRVAAAMAAEYPETNANAGVNVIPLSDHVLGGVRPALFVLLGAVGLVLLIACANVASLMLARGAERERELGVRAALGAGRPRLVRQLVTESAVLALAGGLAGVALAYFAVQALVAASPPDFPRLDAITIDARILGFGLVMTLLTVLLFGLTPAVQLSRPDLRPALGWGARSVGIRPGSRLRSALVVSEIALALVLLIGAGLLGRSFVRLLANDLGFAADDRATVQLFLWDRNPTAEQRISRVRELEQRLEAVRGVEEVGLVSALPFHPTQIDTEDVLDIEGRPPSATEVRRVQTTVASPDYFDVMEIPLISGRAFTDQDRAGAPGVAIINETLARRHFGNEDPVGKRVRIGIMSAPRPWQIVGVVGDVRPTRLDSDPRAELFVPYEQRATGGVTFVARTSRNAEALLQTLRDEVWAVDPQQTIYHIGTVKQIIRDTLIERRFHLVLLGALSVVALVLSLIGTYGLIRFATEQRRGEIGVRMALGARRSEVTLMIVGDAIRMVLPGIVLGVVAALGLTRFLRTMLYGVTPADPATYLQLAAVMLVVAIAAASLPAWRAARTDPMRVLRQE